MKPKLIIKSWLRKEQLDSRIEGFDGVEVLVFREDLKNGQKLLNDYSFGTVNLELQELIGDTVLDPISPDAKIREESRRFIDEGLNFSYKVDADIVTIHFAGNCIAVGGSENVCRNSKKEKILETFDDFLVKMESNYPEKLCIENVYPISWMKGGRAVYSEIGSNMHDYFSLTNPRIAFDTAHLSLTLQTYRDVVEGKVETEEGVFPVYTDSNILEIGKRVRKRGIDEIFSEELDKIPASYIKNVHLSNSGSYKKGFSDGEPLLKDTIDLNKLTPQLIAKGPEYIVLETKEEDYRAQPKNALYLKGFVDKLI